MVTLKPDSATRTITITPADVGTTLTISAPSSAKKDTSFPISGILIRNDTGGPVPYASIPLSYNGISLGTATTGVDGDYLKTVSIGTDGTFTLKARFAGGSGYAASEATRGLTIGLPTPLTTIVSIILPIAVGLGAVYLSTRR